MRFAEEKNGNVFLNKKAISRKEQVRNSVFIMQETEFQFFTNTVFSELLYGKKHTDELKTQIETMLKKLDLWEIRNRHPFSLSCGQMQKLSLLIAYFSHKQVVVLDEPTAGLDYESMKHCVDMLFEMRKNKFVFVITHDFEFISKSCNKAIFLKKGQVQKQFDIASKQDFDTFRLYSQENLKETHEIKNHTKKRVADPRIKLLLFISSMFIEVVSYPPLILTTFVAVILISLYEKRLKNALFWTSLFSAVLILPQIFDSNFFMFTAQLLPRFILLGATITTMAFNDGASYMIAALRKLKIHEKIIMICSVSFRFFPVLKNDLFTMHQAIKTRGFFEKASQKVAHFYEFLEILLIPLTLRVIRIAEALSASAQTRGIDLKRKRTSYLKVKFNIADYCLLLILTALTIFAFFIHL